MSGQFSIRKCQVTLRGAGIQINMWTEIDHELQPLTTTCVCSDVGRQKITSLSNKPACIYYWSPYASKPVCWLFIIIMIGLGARGSVGDQPHSYGCLNSISPISSQVSITDRMDTQFWSGLPPKTPFYIPADYSNIPVLKLQKQPD